MQQPASGAQPAPVKTLVFLVGPPAVGKMAVGMALQELTGLRLFHNHLSIEAVLPLFPFGSPAFSRLVDGFRVRVFEEVADGDLPGLIFTYVWAFDQPSDLEFVTRMKGIFEARGGRTVFAELWTDLETRLERNTTALRLAQKPSKRDLEASRARLLEHEQLYRMSSDGHFPFPAHLRIDNTAMLAQDAAQRIARHFSIRRHG